MDWLDHITLVWKFCQRHLCISLDDIASIFIWCTFSFPNTQFWGTGFLEQSLCAENRLQVWEDIYSLHLGVTWWGLRQLEFLGWLTSCPSRLLHLPQGKRYHFFGVPWSGNGWEALILEIARSYLLKNWVLFYEVEGFFLIAPEVLVGTTNVRRNQHLLQNKLQGKTNQIFENDFSYDFAYQVVNITLICFPLMIITFWDSSNYSFMCIYLEYEQCKSITVKDAFGMKWHNSLNSHI